MRPAAFHAKIPLRPARAKRLPAKHCHGALLENFLYNYPAWFYFPFSIIGQPGPYESLALFTIDRVQVIYSRRFAMEDCKVCIIDIYCPMNTIAFSAWSFATMCAYLDYYNTIHFVQYATLTPPSM